MVGLQLDRFATMVLLMLDPPSGQLSIANAGHPPPLLRKADGRVLEIGSEAANVPVGLFADIEYEFAETVIEPDEALVMWTDGIHESMNEEFEELGIERLITLLADISPGELSAETIGACFIEAANAHRDEREPDDDMCLVAFTRSDQPATKVGR